MVYFMWFNVNYIVVIVTVSSWLGLGLQGQEILFIEEDYSSSEDSDCNTPNGGKGKCVDIRTCPILLSLVNNRNHNIQFLQQTKCGWNQSYPMPDSKYPGTLFSLILGCQGLIFCRAYNSYKVLIPGDYSRLLSYQPVWEKCWATVCCDRNWNCTTPDNEPGYCTQITSCPHLLAMITKFPVSLETVTSIQNNRCGSDKQNVCCTSSSSSKPKSTTIATKSLYDDDCQLSSIPPDPSSYCCGQEDVFDRITGGEETSIRQYPWTAAIEYARNNTTEVKCGGTLISGTYVLTAAHCFFSTNWKAVNVRLGDYDIDNNGKDCVDIGGGAEACTDDPMIISIEKTILHPDYHHFSRAKVNDIALIKLRDTARFTDFIRPICLPSTDFTETTAKTPAFIAAGWGAVDEIQNYSPKKLQVVLPFFSHENCSNLYRRANISLADTQICAGGKKGKDTCAGDSGGALMLVKGQFTEIAGVTSFGHTPCGLENKPGVYTKVHYYVPWIRSVIGSN